MHLNLLFKVLYIYNFNHKKGNGIFPRVWGAWRGCRHTLTQSHLPGQSDLRLHTANFTFKMELHAQLVGLVGIGKGLLTRLHDIELWVNNPIKPPEYFSDPKFTKVNKLLVSKYPEQLALDKVRLK